MPTFASRAPAPLAPSIFFSAALLVLCACSHAASRSTAEVSAKPVQIEEATIAELQVAMASGALTSRALTQHYLDRIARYDKTGPKLNAFLLVNPHALEEADALDKERAAKGVRGPLHGIPVVVKDNMNTKDMPTTGGSLAFVGAQPQSDAFIVAKLREAGVLILGKTHLHALAPPGTTLSSLCRQTPHPDYPNPTPRASSAATPVS